MTSAFECKKPSPQLVFLDVDIVDWDLLADTVEIAVQGCNILSAAFQMSGEPGTPEGDPQNDQKTVTDEASALLSTFDVANNVWLNTTTAMTAVFDKRYPVTVTVVALTTLGDSVTFSKSFILN